MSDAMQMIGATWTLFPEGDDPITPSPVVDAIRDAPLGALKVAGVMIATEAGGPVSVSFRVLGKAAAKRAYAEQKRQVAEEVASSPDAGAPNE